MRRAVYYIAEVSLLILLFPIAVIGSDYTAVLACSFFCLMIAYTVRSISDTQSIPLTLFQLGASAAFGAVSLNPLCYLPLCNIRLGKYDSLRIFAPGVCYTVTAVVTGKSLYGTLLYGIVLVVISAVIFLLESALIKYLDTKNKADRAVSVCALGELREKKLNEELRIKNYLSDRNARLEERENISRSIHNSVGHSITAAIMTLDAADMLFDSSPERAREKLGAANERIRGSLASIRRAVRVLDSDDKPIPMSDLCDSLEAICDSFTMDTGITVRANLSGCEPESLVRPKHAELFCSAAGELLSNGLRHGNATSFILSLTSDSRHIQLVVTDNGQSDFNDSNRERRIQNGFGLKKLISFCERNGGKAEFSNPNGFKSVITLPIIEEES